MDAAEATAKAAADAAATAATDAKAKADAAAGKWGGPNGDNTVKTVDGSYTTTPCLLLLVCAAMVAIVNQCKSAGERFIRT